MEQPNLTYIKNMSAGDTEFELKVIHIIKSEFFQEQQMYFSCIQKQDPKITAEIVHKIKHKIGILGLMKGYEFTTSFELELKKGKFDRKSEFESILVTINNYLQQI